MEADWSALSDYVERTGASKASELLGLETATEGWEDLGVKEAVHSYRKQINSGVYYIKGVGDISTPVQTILDLTRDQSRRKLWDSMFKEGRNVHEFTEHSRLVYEQFTAPWPVSNRDFLLANYVQHTAEFSVSVNFSVEHPSVPPVRGVVRAHTEVGGFICRKLGERETRVTFVLCMDPRGAIPQAIVNASQKKQAQKISKIRAVLTKSA